VCFADPNGYMSVRGGRCAPAENLAWAGYIITMFGFRNRRYIADGLATFERWRALFNER